jgi:phospholipid/cholesterol/gamma-HCH transport system substrate-binding protein
LRGEAELKVGVLVVIGLVLLGIVLTLSSDWHVGVPGEELTLRFNALSNVKGGGDVQLAGVHIGKVVGIRLDPEGFGEVTIRVEPPITLREGITAELKVLGFVGETYIAMTNGPQDAAPLDYSKPIKGKDAPNMMALVGEMQDGLKTALELVESMKVAVDESHGEVKSTAAAARDLIATTSASVDDVVAQARPLLDNILALTDALDSQLPTLVGRAEETLAHADEQILETGARLGATADAMDELIAVSQSNIDGVVDNANAAIGDTRTALSDMVEEARGLRASLETALAETTDAVTTEKTRLNETLARLDEAVVSGQALMARLDSVAAKADSGEGAIGRLLTDDSVITKAGEALDSAGQLLDRLDKLSGNIEQIADRDASLATIGGEVTYRSSFEGVQSEFGVLLRPNATQSAYAAVSTRDSENLTTFILAQRVGPVWGRLGFVDSEATVGLDWAPNTWLTLRTEALQITRPLLDAADDVVAPRVDIEAMIRPFKRARFIIGGENVLEDDRAVIFGLRTDY